MISTAQRGKKDAATCVIGVDCSHCTAEADRLEREFDAAVAAGKYDAQGYTPAERKAQTRRLQREGRLF